MQPHKFLSVFLAWFFCKYDKYVSYRFPLKNPNLLEKWICAMRREKWMPSKYSVLCENHFAFNDYNTRVDYDLEDGIHQTKKHLKPDAVPSVFYFPPHLVNIAKLRHVPAKRKAPRPAREEVPVKKPRSQPTCTTNDHNSWMSPSKLIPKMKRSLDKKGKWSKSLRRKISERKKQWKAL